MTWGLRLGSLLPNGPRISCADFPAWTLSTIIPKVEAPVSCMRLLDGSNRSKELHGRSLQVAANPEISTAKTADGVPPTQNGGSRAAAVVSATSWPSHTGLHTGHGRPWRPGVRATLRAMYRLRWPPTEDPHHSRRPLASRSSTSNLATSFSFSQRFAS